MNDANPNMPDAHKCPQCGTPLKNPALGGLCPACLLAQGASDTVTDAKQPSFNPPSVAELAALFPQLEILELIGKGGMGAVYKARQKQLDRIVALKILPPGIGNDPAFAERFAREAKALAKLNHPNIVTLYEFGRADGLFFFLMEFVDGVNLRQLLSGERISPREALAIVPQICDALQFAHDHRIVHRDIKPENILMDRRGRVKVADFGVAKLVGPERGSVSRSASQNESVQKSSEAQSKSEAAAGHRPALPELTDAGKIMGTPQYMAPEQMERPSEVDHRADIYALGVVFYQMLTGELPGKSIEPPSKKVQIDVRLDEIVLRALEKNPERRYEQASVLKTQVETVATSKPKTTQPAIKYPPRPRSLTIVALLFILSGVFTAWDVVSDWLIGMRNVNFGVLALPIGIGLLRYRPAWRITALTLLSLVAAIGIVLGILAATGQVHVMENASVKLFGNEITGAARWPLAVIAVLLGVSLLCWFFYVLMRADVRKYFIGRKLDRPWIEWVVFIGTFVLFIGVSWLIGKTHSSFTSVALVLGVIITAIWVWMVLAQKPRAARETESHPTWLQRELLNKNTFARWIQIACFAAALVLFVVGILKLTQFGLQLHEILFGILLVSILALLLVAIGFLVRPASPLSATVPPQPEIKSRRRRKAIWNLVIAIAIALILRTFVVGIYYATTDAVSPEVPRGSRVLVWKLTRSFEPGDVIVYKKNNRNLLGRVAAELYDENQRVRDRVLVERQGDLPTEILARDIIGKVIFNTRRSTTPATETQLITSPVQFGPVIEQVVTDAIDFDSGKLIDLPLPHPLGDRDPARYEWFNSSESSAWKRDHGVDAVNGNHALMSANLQLMKLDDKDWNRISPDELLRRLLAQNATDNFGDMNHKTFGFKTREGGMGLLQIMEDRFVPGTATREPGVKIRYKLARTPPQNAPVNVQRAKLTFGKVVEHTVEEAFDFDTGKQAVLPKDSVTRGSMVEAVLNGFAWMDREGMDGIHETTGIFLCVGMKIKAVSPSAWEELNPDELREVLQDVRRETSRSVEKTNVYAFETREGAQGILEILDFTDEGVKLRYKLLEADFAQTSGVPKTEFTASLPDGSFVELASLMYGPGSNPRRTQGATTNLIDFWKPDGTRDTEYGRWSFGPSQLSSARNPDLEYRGIVARWGGPDANNARLMGWQFDGKPLDAADGQFAVTPKGESAANWVGLMQSFPRDQETATIRFALASGPYSSGPSSNVMWATTAQTPFGSFSIGKVFDHNGNAAVTLTHNLKECDYRLVTTMPEPRKPKSFLSGLLWEWKQETRRGQQFPPVYGRRVEGTEFSGKWEFPGVASTNEPRVWLEVRPVQWVEFRNVALNPGEGTNFEIHVPKAAAPRISKNDAAAQKEFREVFGI